MTPKEKADSIFQQMLKILWHTNSEAILCKQFALIAVDEILTIVKSYEKQNCKLLMDNIKIIYWHEVKQEIEKL